MNVGVVILLSSFYGVTAAITYSIAPFNTTAGTGSTATLACIVDGKQSSDTVKWKKAGETAALTVDATVAGGSRYNVQGTYNLTISSVTRGDEGGYTCEAGSSLSQTAYLTVVDLPRNLSIYWSTAPVPNTRANLTCRAAHASPAPSFSWYKNDVIYSVNPIYYTIQSIGSYVDAFSVIPVPVTKADEGTRFRCQIDYTGLPRAMETSLVTVLSNGGVAPVVGVWCSLLTLGLAFISRL